MTDNPILLKGFFWASLQQTYKGYDVTLLPFYHK